ncbi:MAG: polyprenyl synthetase family protein [Bacillota bacterium]
MATVQPLLFPECPELLRLDAVEKKLASALECESPGASRIAGHVFQARGKRLRPLLVLLISSLAPADDEAVAAVAAASELVHVASLIHDDIIDEAEERRGAPSTHVVWGRHSAVLAGDFLFARAFSLLVEHRQHGAVRYFSRAIADMCESEMEQAHSRFDPDAGQAAYFRRVHKKTASLFVACCRAGADLSSLEPELTNSLEHFGRDFGMAFQITDDLLDFTATPEECGKPVAADFPRGIITLPTAYLLEDAHLSGPVRELLRRRKITPEDWRQVRDLAVASGALEEARSVAQQYAAKASAALEKLPRVRQRDLLHKLCYDVLERRR